MEIIYLCPSTPIGSCHWEGSACDIVPHFEEEHRDYLLNTNFINLNVGKDNALNYIISLVGETYLIQTSYSSTTQVLELRLRYLGNASNAAKIRYHLEVIIGNFGFTSKDNYSGYNTVTNTKRGSIEVDVQGIKLTCGKRKLDYILGYVHIENSLTRYGHRSFKRPHYDKKSLEKKVSVSFRQKTDEKVPTNQKKRVQNANAKPEHVCFTEEVRLSFIHKTVDDLIEKAMNQANMNTTELYKDDQDEEVIFGRCHSYTNVFHLATTNYTSPRQYHVVDLSKQEEEEEKEKNGEEEAEAENILQEVVVSNTYVPIAETPNLEYIENLHMETRLSIIRDNIDANETVERSTLFHRYSEEIENFDRKLRNIMCQRCGLYMIPPIYLCHNEHSLCATCKSFNICDICGFEVTDLINYDLENISKNIMHPCRFAEKGCGEYCSVYQIRSHEIFCEHFKYTCPLCGKFGMFLEVENHFKLIHPSVKVVKDYKHPFGKDSEFVIANERGLFFCMSHVHNASIECKVDFCGVDRVSFSCEIVVMGKKRFKIYSLPRHGNGCNMHVLLSELKTEKLKWKNAILYIKPY